MLVLTRKPGQSFYIGDIRICIKSSTLNRVQVAIDAPDDVRVLREELKTKDNANGSDHDNDRV